MVDETAKCHVSTFPPQLHERDTNGMETEKPAVALGSINWYYPKRCVRKGLVLAWTDGS